MARRKKVKKKMEFSKWIINYMFFLTTVVSAVAIFVSVTTLNVEPLVVLIPLVFAELGVGTMFYYKKAERENIIKLKNKYRNLSFDESSFSSGLSSDENCG